MQTHKINKTQPERQEGRDLKSYRTEDNNDQEDTACPSLPNYVNEPDPKTHSDKVRNTRSNSTLCTRDSF